MFGGDTRRTRLLQNRLAMLDEFGASLIARGDAKGAAAAYQSAVDVRRRLADADPADRELRRDLSLGLDKCGDALVAAGDPRGALNAYRESLEICRRLSAEDAGDREAKRDLVISFNKVGDALAKSGDFNGALNSYREGLNIARSVAEGDASAAAKRDLSVSLNRVGDALKARHNLPSALLLYRESLEIRRELLTAEPNNHQARIDFALIVAKMGQLAEAGGKDTVARNYFVYAQQMFAEVARAAPDNADAKHLAEMAEHDAGRLMPASRPHPPAPPQEDPISSRSGEN